MENLKTVLEPEAKKILNMVDNGIINERDALIMCLKWMSRHEILVMLKLNGFKND